MKTGVTKPKNLDPYCDEILLMNCEQEINASVVQILMNESYYGLFTAEHFLAFVWYEKSQNKWAAEVRQKGEHEISFVADTIEQLSFEINQEYGKGELEIFH